MPPRRVLRPRGRCPENPQACADDEINRLLRDRNLNARIRRRLQAERRRRLEERRGQIEIPVIRRRGITQQLNVGQNQAEAQAQADYYDEDEGGDAGDVVYQPVSTQPNPMWQRFLSLLNENRVGPSPNERHRQGIAEILRNDAAVRLQRFIRNRNIYRNRQIKIVGRPGFIVIKAVKTSSANSRMTTAIEKVRAYKEKMKQGDREALNLYARLSGMAGYRSITRPQYSILEDAIRQSSRDDESFMDRLRRIRNIFRSSVGNRNTNLSLQDARTLGYYDLAERMALLRESTLNRSQKIPVTDYTVEGRFLPGIERTPAGLVTAIMRALIRSVFKSIPDLRVNVDLISITIPFLPVIGNDESIYNHTVFTGAQTNPQNLGQVLLQAIEELLQSSQEIAFDRLLDDAKNAINFEVQVQIMKAPRANGWSPRVEVEEYFVKSVVRYIPPEVYLNDKICIPIAVLTAGLRVTDDQGVISYPDYEEIELDGTDGVEKFVAFDSREPCNRNYFRLPDKYNYIRRMSRLLMEEAGITSYQQLSIDSCEDFAYILGIQIHVIFQEIMCKRMLRFGSPENPRSITILIRDDHAFPVLKPWRLSGNGSPSLWCDSCHTCVTKSWTPSRVAHHRLQCHNTKESTNKDDGSLQHGKEYIHRRFNRLWHCKNNEPLMGPYCFTCEKFCVTPKEAQKDGSGSLEECVLQGHRVMDDVGMGECVTCNCVLPIEWPDVIDKPNNKYEIVNHHKCYIPNPNLKIGDSTKYYVWDIETIIVEDVHVPIYIYARNLYNENEYYDFDGMSSFCKSIICEKFKDSTWIAHNSGGFDSNFVHTWLENSGIMHTRIPSPMSIHRSLETVVDTLNIRFIDSYSFIPMSLAKIGPSFNLPVCKGDFPHKFSSLEHLDYEGEMPPCDSPDDWYSLQEIRASSIEKADVSTLKFKTWHEEEKKKYVPFTTTKWVYKNELKKYCKQDCDVLAGALQCLRDSFMGADSSVVIGSGVTSFSLCPVDPLCYLTMAQVCQQLYIAGLYKANGGLRIAHIPLPDRRQNNNKVKWLMDEEKRVCRPIWKACTHLREWLADDALPVDGYAEVNGVRHVWEYRDCLLNGCPQCTEALERNSNFGCTNRDVYSKLKNRRKQLQLMGYTLHERWSHEEGDLGVIDNSLSMYDCMAGQRQRNDGGFYGGRTEVFKPLWKCEEDEKIKYIDVVSLYPWVCATQKMCVGFPRIYMHDRVEKERMYKTHDDPYFGYAHVRVKGCNTDYFGGLPRKDKETGRLVFDNSEYTITCFIDELHERMENGLELLDVYEVWHWDEVNAVEGPMSGYVAYFLRDKMECSGWKALCGRIPETDEEKNEICDDLERENLYLCRPRPDKVQDNPGGRQLAKLRLNMLWGKFVQTPNAVNLKFISTYEDYVKLWYDNQVNKSSLQFRRIHDSSDFMEVKYNYNSSLRAPSNTHYYLGGSCTAQARLKLTSMLRKVGKERALYCDTDSVVYVEKEGDDEIETGEALGQWSSELDEGVWGVEFLSLAPKCYTLLYNDKGREKEKESGILKTKGVTLTAQNLKNIHADNMRKIILTEVFGDMNGDDLPSFVVQAKTFNIRMDHGGDRSMINMHGEKVVRCVYSKRKIQVPDVTHVDNVHFIDTLPFC